MNTTFDHVEDTNGSELTRLAHLYEFPQFVKQASMKDTRQPGELAHSVYADHTHRRYPCHNAASTWLSNLFFEEKQAAYKPTDAAQIRQRLDRFAQYWGIKGAVDQMRSRRLELTKNADDRLPDEDFAFVWQGAQGNKQRNLRIKNALEVKTAAHWLHQYRDQLPYSDRHVIASKILEKAARYGAGLGEHEQFIERQAGHGVCEPAEVVTMLNNRARLAKTGEQRQALLKLAETVQSKPRYALVPQQLIKLAATVDMVDRVLHLPGRYTSVIPRPEDVIFKATYSRIKSAAENACALTSGTMYDKNDLARIKLADLSAAFGRDFADEIQSGIDGVDPEKLAEMAATMPRGDAELFDKIAASAGIAPIRIKAASSAERLPAQVQEELAAAY